MDFSICAERDQRGRGVREALMRDLEARARSLGYHKMVLAAFLSNAPVKRLSDRHSFQTVGVYHERGLLAGR